MKRAILEQLAKSKSKEYKGIQVKVDIGDGFSYYTIDGCSIGETAGGWKGIIVDCAGFTVYHSGKERPIRRLNNLSMRRAIYRFVSGETEAKNSPFSSPLVWKIERVQSN